MIRTLDLFGFKSFVSESIEFGKLTVLTGLNSSGKSSIIQALLMLEKYERGKDFSLDGHGDVAELKNPYSQDFELSSSGKKHNTCIKIPPVSDLRVISPAFPKLIYIAADRYGPEVSVSVFSGNNYDIGSRGENIFKCIDHYSDEILPEKLQHSDSEGDTFLFNLKAWLSVISPNTEFKHVIQKYTDTSYATFNNHRSKNVGFGLSYTLPVITSLLLGSIIENSVVIIENPEAHLHPRGQTEIAKLISLCVQSGTQVIIETHSDHLFDGIRLFAKENDTNFHELIKTYWFELDENKNTETESVEIDKDGRLTNCPKGMFDQFEINASKFL